MWFGKALEGIHYVSDYHQSTTVTKENGFSVVTDLQINARVLKKSY